MAFTILTDSTANLETKLAQRQDIRILPFSYFIGDAEYQCDDTDSFRDKAYYDAIRKGTRVTTAQINPQTYMDHMEPILQNGQDVLFIGLSSGISGSFASAVMARQELLERYPERSICLVDSLGAGLGEGLLALRAAKCRDNGMSLEDRFFELYKNCKGEEA